MRMTLSILLVCVTQINVFATAVTNSWKVDLTRNPAAVFSVWHGDKITLAADIGINVTSATFYWQAPDMGTLWWEKPAVSETGVVSVEWTPEMDSGASTYSFYFRAGDVYRPRGTLLMQESPGDVVNSIPLPVQTIDFATVTVTNAPWLTAETDPHASAWQSTHLATTNPHGVTAEDVGVDTNAIAVAEAHAESAHGITPGGGFRGGDWSEALEGGAVGAEAKTTYGGAVGHYAESGRGGAVGAEAITTTGGAVGYRAAAGAGFAGGAGATTYYGDQLEDAIQLGSGNNPYPRTMQVYDKQLLDSGGRIPIDRLPDLSATHVGALPLAGGTMTGALTLAADGIVWQGVNIATNYTVRVEYDGTNVNFNVYEVPR